MLFDAYKNKKEKERNQKLKAFLTDRQAWLLAVIAYLDIDIFYQNSSYKQKRLKYLFDVMKYYLEKGNEIDYNGGFTQWEFLEAAKEIAKDEILNKLMFTDYKNDNKQNEYDIDFTGFVAIALKDDFGNCVITIRGSEGANQAEVEGFETFLGKEGLGDFLTVDWTKGNVRFLSGKSVQFQPLLDFVKKNKAEFGKKTFLTGHSQGAANAVYACAYFDEMQAKVFDGTGCAQLLDKKQRQRLKQSDVVNYVLNGDLIGSLLFHSEKTVYIASISDKKICYKSNDKKTAFPLILDTEKLQYAFYFHYLQAIKFDEKGNVIPSQPGKWAKEFSKISKIICILNLATNNKFGYQLYHDIDAFIDFKIAQDYTQKLQQHKNTTPQEWITKDKLWKRAYQNSKKRKLSQKEATPYSILEKDKKQRQLFLKEQSDFLWQTIQKELEEQKQNIVKKVCSFGALSVISNVLCHNKVSKKEENFMLIAKISAFIYDTFLKENPKKGFMYLNTVFSFPNLDLDTFVKEQQKNGTLQTILNYHQDT